MLVRCIDNPGTLNDLEQGKIYRTDDFVIGRGFKPKDVWGKVISVYDPLTNDRSRGYMWRFEPVGLEIEESKSDIPDYLFVERDEDI
jgi:hypothetical protein